jgi:hypothetical protein
MSREAFSLPPMLAYADPVARAWGVAVLGEQAQMVVGQLEVASDAPSALEAGAELGSDPWTLTTEAGALHADPLAAEVSAAEPDPGLALVRVSGPVPGTDETELSAGGLRHLGREALKAHSVRLLCAWFSPERGMAVVAVRPPRARGQDHDELSVICIGEQDGMSAFDPRLSSTYGGDGRLRRVGVELWLGENEEADMYSLRMAGEATGAAAGLEADGVTVLAQPFRCHSRGESGAGVYLLISGS